MLDINRDTCPFLENKVDVKVDGYQFSFHFVLGTFYGRSLQSFLDRSKFIKIAPQF